MILQCKKEDFNWTSNIQFIRTKFNIDYAVIKDSYINIKTTVNNKEFFISICKNRDIYPTFYTKIIYNISNCINILNIENLKYNFYTGLSTGLYPTLDSLYEYLYNIVLNNFICEKCGETIFCYCNIDISSRQITPWDGIPGSFVLTKESILSQFNVLEF